ncbi:DUF1735 domain-containing protein [Fulvivirga sediminis]|uniref:DUF1735 domain-containing protein n=1 Tax=Fulvivirga sediminis TaxID=2803949 RepID=A0A937JY30_9BACT|nr:DUF1735 domain-containing protein [Fulvivirga sediminis]MBL3656048.1 DUF1735 domain-containing protein [Fulvivirga sediminis]
MSLIITSCLDEDPMMDPGQTEGIVELLDISALTSNITGSNLPHIYNNSYTILEKTSFDVIVSYSGAYTAPEDLSIEIDIDEELLNSYNEDLKAYQDENPDEDIQLFQLLPESLYTLPENGTFNSLIPKGEKKDSIEVILHTPDFEPGVSYAIPLTIKSSSAGTVSGNFYQAIYVVSARNQYDGIYEIIAGSITRNSASGPDPNLGGEYKEGLKMNLATRGANSLLIEPKWRDGSNVGGVDNTQISVASNNEVTVSSDNDTMKNTTGSLNVYYPDGLSDDSQDKKAPTFVLNFDWGNDPNTRVIQELTLRYVGPRD